MSGAKVNAKLVSFDTPLRNGDIVEIIPRESAHPTAKWLEFARTSLAKKHIRTVLEVEERGTAGAVKKLDSRLTRKKKEPSKKAKKR
jgi:GTP pyrophosphokinase